MIDLRTNYLGLTLDNPLVPSASPISKSLDHVKQLEDAGASAIVMYSLFEEDLRAEEEHMIRFGIEQGIGHHEAEHYLPSHHEVTTTLERYLEHLARVKTSVAIPVIASLNGTSMSHWLDHGKDLEDAGADALELNIYYIAANIDETAEMVEARYANIVHQLTQHVEIPVTVKLSPQFSALPNFVRRLEQAGAKGVSLFNRFYQPNINLNDLGVDYHLTLSNPGDSLLRMRWIALLYGRVKLSLAATGGIHSATEALKAIAAGANVTHLCSTLLIHGPNQLSRIKSDMESWLEEHEYESIKQLTGSISQKHAPDPAAYERANYSKTLNTFKLSTKNWH
jgi:dihydroorotate dehydrogenase (fumarate)